MTAQSGMPSEVVLRNGFSLERLMTLCAVVDAGSIVSAAGPNVSRQSQFSRQIKELEAAMDRPLFVREGKALRPTECGQHLARLARTFVGAVDELAKADARRPETLSIVAGEGVLRWLVVPQLHVLRQLVPPVNGLVHSLNTEGTVREVTLGKMDLGIVRADAPSEGLEAQSLGWTRYTLVVPRSLLRTRNADEIFEGRPIPFAELSGGGQLASAAAAIAREAGVSLNRVLHAETASLLLAAVESEQSAAFLPSQAVAHLPSERFALIGLPGADRLRRELKLIWSREAVDQKPALRRALRVFARALEQGLAAGG